MKAEEFISEYSSLGEPLYRLAYHLLESEEDAQDAVQDLFLKLWKIGDGLDSVQNPRAYCLTMMRNMCIDRLRNRAEMDSKLPEIAVEAGETVEGRETLSRVMKAVESLPEGQRKVLRMRVFEDLTYGEIEKRTGMNYLTVRVLLSQARRKIRKYR